MGKQRGVSLSGLIVTLAILAFIGVLGAKMLPSYIEFFAVKKILLAMEKNGETKGTVRDIRNAFDRRNTIEGVQSVNGEDLDISKDESGETVVSANWSVKVPMVSNISACIDFSATTAK